MIADTTLNLGKLMEIFNAQTGTVNILWNIFVAVSLGVLGFVLKEKELRENWKIKIVFSVGFILFAIGNLTAITRSQKILVAVATVLQSAGKELAVYGPVLEAHTARSVCGIQMGHIIMSAIIVLGIWIPDIAARIRGRQAAAKIG